MKLVFIILVVQCIVFIWKSNAESILISVIAMKKRLLISVISVKFCFNFRPIYLKVQWQMYFYFFLGQLTFCNFVQLYLFWTYYSLILFDLEIFGSYYFNFGLAYIILYTMRWKTCSRALNPWGFIVWLLPVTIVCLHTKKYVQIQLQIKIILFLKLHQKWTKMNISHVYCTMSLSSKDTESKMLCSHFIEET